MMKFLRVLSVALLLGLDRVLKTLDLKQGEGPEHVEPVKQADEYEHLLHLYQHGTPEQQKEAERILTDPAAKEEHDELFLRPFRRINKGKTPPEQRGSKLGDTKLSDLRQVSERNAAEQSLKKPVPYHEIIK